MRCGVPLAHLKTMGRASSPNSVNRWPDQATVPIANAAKAVTAVLLKEPEWICIAHPFINSNRTKVAAVEAEAVVRRDHPDCPWQDWVRSCLYLRQRPSECVFRVLLELESNRPLMPIPALETVTVSPYRAEMGLSSGAYPSPQPAPFGLYPCRWRLTQQCL